MFPTPPSHEPNPISSPSNMQSENTSLEGLNESSTCIRRPQDNYPGLGSPPDEPTEVRLETNNFHSRGPQHPLRMHLQDRQLDWSYVFKPPVICKIPGSSKYAPLPAVPSHHLPPLALPPNPIYKASWQYPPTQHAQNQSTSSVHPLPHPQHSMLAGPNIPNQLHLRPGLSPISPVPNSIRGMCEFIYQP